MATQARGWHAFRVYLEMIKIEHSIFALPFAAIGMLWAARATGQGWPTAWQVLWIVVAMVSCRSAAMAYNRIADREIDALNPRTKMRAIPAGIISLRSSTVFFWSSVVVFFVAAGMLNRLALALAPIAIGVTLLYSITKRFTPLCHFVLGLSLGLAPGAAWIGVTGAWSWTPLVLVGAVLFWTAGFDIIYSLQDDSFDSEQGLRSLPETLGRRRALWVSRASHIAAIGLLATATWQMGGGWLAWAGVAFATGLLLYEQSLVRPDDLSRVNLAFFTLNGYVSLGYFGFVLADLLVRG